MIAYLDAGSGSMIVGVVAAGAAGVGVAVRSGLSRFKRKGKGSDDAAPADEVEGTDDADDAVEDTDDADV